MSIKTKGCNLLIDNVTGLFGIFDIESSSLRDFVQPASFDEQYALLPPGLNTPIVWMYYKETRAADEFKFERDNDQDEQYKIDLIVPETKEAVANVLPLTATESFWDSFMPFHSISHFIVRNKTCKFQQFGVLVYTWTVPENLDQNSTYRLKLSTNVSDEEHLSGEFRLGRRKQETRDGVGRFNARVRAMLGVICLAFLVLMIARWLFRSIKKYRRSRMRVQMT